MDDTTATELRQSPARRHRYLAFAAGGLILLGPAIAAAAGSDDGPKLGQDPASSASAVTSDDSTSVSTDDTTDTSTDDTTDTSTDDTTDTSTDDTTDDTTDTSTDDTTDTSTDDTTDDSTDTSFDDHGDDDDSDVAPPSFTKTYSGAGGSITVTAAGGTLTLDTAAPADGYSMKIEDDGGDEVEVRFETDSSGPGSGHETRIRVRLDGNRLREEIRED